MDFDRLFPDNRENINAGIRQCQLVMLRMFKILDYLCTKHQVSYFLNGGSLLGAIRHKSFIPWDDDLDIGMTRDNYEKFVQCVVPELPKDIFFQSDETDKFFPACHIIEAKLRDRYSSYIRKEEDKLKWLKWQDGLQIDIAVFDRAFLPHNFFIAALNRSLTFFLQHKGNKARARALKWISKYSPFPLVYASSFINGRKMIRSGAYYIKQKEISCLIKTKFEDMEVYIPAGWHKYLKRRYGNYMKPPPVEKRKGQHGVNIPDAFTPSQHSEILHWKERHQLQSK
ncbi:MAG TPA: LicD family protein [Chitinophagaceae bacterium]|nr:LicD family protein [Chitinophagaceae bacterium]